MPRKALIRFRLHQIGFVFQAYNLVPVLTVAENIALTMQLQGISSQQIKQRITEVIAQVGLSDKYHTRPAELSGGQQQRVAIARALATHPQFILADEPTASLDSATAADILGLMQTLNETEGVTFLFSTHDSRIMQRAKRIIELEDGQIKQIESM
jgi:putative ABC transport system ATP-binding protein